jgi:hypothetical protein
MRLSLPFLLPFVLLAQVVTAQNAALNTLPVICAGVKEVSTCKIKVIVPSGVKVNMKTIKVPTVGQAQYPRANDVVLISGSGTSAKAVNGRHGIAQP